MRRELTGRRIAVYAPSGEDRSGGDVSAAVVAALRAAGAEVDRLPPADQASDAAWHSARYAGLVVIGRPNSDDPKLTQLTREFLVAEKPIAAFGKGADLCREAGAMDGQAIAADVTDGRTFAERVAKELASKLDERAVDEMSDMSFPASDPPSTTPVAAKSPAVESPRRAD